MASSDLQPHIMRRGVSRADFVPRLTYAGVEGLLLELADSSPVRRWVLRIRVAGVGMMHNTNDADQ